MKKTGMAAVFLILLSLVSAAEPYQRGDKNAGTGRLLTGRVADRQDNPLSGAVVYLTDTRTRAIKSFIVSEDGMYRFPALSRNDDYEVYAQFQGKKSDTKTVSQFDDRPQLNINLKIDTR
jgi:hypothetical protein